MSWKSCDCDDAPDRWLGDALGVDLGTTGLAARAARCVDGVTGARDEALALFRHVAGLPFQLSDPAVRTDADQLHVQDGGDGYFKATLWLHLLRIRRIPARMRWVRLDPKAITHGLWDFARLAGMPFFYPLTEVWLEGGWSTVDAYVVDPALFARIKDHIARHRLAGAYFVHRDGVCEWDGRSDAIQRFSPNDPASLPLADLGCFHSHADFLRRYGVEIPETAVTKLAYEQTAGQLNTALVQLRAQNPA